LVLVMSLTNFCNWAIHRSFDTCVCSRKYPAAFALDERPHRMRVPDYPKDEAVEAIETLASLRWLFEQNGDPVGSALADDALDHVATALHRSGLLDVLITRAAKRYWPRRA
jgi:hypothetical protein